LVRFVAGLFGAKDIIESQQCAGNVAWPKTPGEPKNANMG